MQNMMKRWPRLFLLVAVWATCLVPVTSHDIALAQTCPAHKIVIPFINGVFVTKKGAKSDLKLLKSAICNNPSDTAMCQNGDFERLYNESGLNNLPADQGTLQSALSLVTGAFQDIIETLWQIAHLNARTSPNWFDYMLYLFMHPESASVIYLTASQTAYAVAHPPTQADLSSMESAMDGWNAAGDDILLTAHSQGNLFAYPLYQYYVSNNAKSNNNNGMGGWFIASYGIAPPSSLIAGQYTLNSDDQVIKLASVADAVLNPGNPPPMPNASQLCTDYVAPTSLSNLGTDASCFADHGLNYYLEKHLRTSITDDLGGLYLQLQNHRYPPPDWNYLAKNYSYSPKLLYAEMDIGASVSTKICPRPPLENSISAEENDTINYAKCTSVASGYDGSSPNRPAFKFIGPWIAGILDGYEMLDPITQTMTSYYIIYTAAVSGGIWGPFPIGVVGWYSCGGGHYWIPSGPDGTPIASAPMCTPACN